MEYYTLIETLKDLTMQDLKRIIRTNKNYLVLDISVFNVGAVVRPILTNNYTRYKNISKDGYSVILPVEYELISEIEEILSQKMEAKNESN